MQTQDAWKDYRGSGLYDPALVQSFTGVTLDSVRRWKNGGFPLGETLLKLRVFLSIMGYSVEELVSLDGEIVLAIEALALGQTSSGEISAALGLSADSVRRLLMGERRTTPEKLADLKHWMTGVSLGEKVSAARVSCSERLGLRPSPEVLKVPIAGVQPPSGLSPACDAGTDHKAFILAAAASMSSLEFFTRRLETNEFSPEERQKFRDLTGESVMRVANQLFRLCSETARKNMEG